MVPKGFWNSPINQLKFLENFAKKFDIKEPKYWGKVTHHQILKEGGGGLLNKNKNSLRIALKQHFPRNLIVDSTH